MNIELVKQVICDSIPNDVNVSNIDVNESGGGLTVKITWDVLKASEPELKIKRMPLEPVMNIPGKRNLAEDLKYEDLDKVKEAFRKKISSEVTNEKYEYDNCKKGVIGATGSVGSIGSKGTASFEGKKFSDISELINGEEENIRREAEWTPIFKDVLLSIPREVKRYNDGFHGIFGYILSRCVQRIAERDRDDKIDVKLARNIIHKLLDAKKPKVYNLFEEDFPKIELNEQKESFGKLNLRRAKELDGYANSIDVLVGAQKINDLFRHKLIRKEDLNSLVGKYSKESIDLFKKKYMFDDYNIDKYCPATLARDDFKLACEIYQKKFGGMVITNQIGDTSVINSKGERISDVDVMFFSNSLLNNVLGGVKKMVDDKSTETKTEEIKNEPPAEKPAGKLSKILYHLKAIKDSILHG